MGILTLRALSRIPMALLTRLWHVIDEKMTASVYKSMVNIKH